MFVTFIFLFSKRFAEDMMSFADKFHKCMYFDRVLGQSSSGRQNQAYWTFFQKKYSFLSERELGSGIALPVAVSCRYGLYHDIKTQNNQFRALVDACGCREANNDYF